MGNLKFNNYHFKKMPHLILDIQKNLLDDNF